MKARTLLVAVLALAATLVGTQSARADTLTITGPSRIVVGTTTLIHYAVTGTADPGASIDWDLTGKSFCFFDYGSTTTTGSGTFSSVGSVQPTVDVYDDDCAGPAVLKVSAIDNQLLNGSRTVLIKHAARWVNVNAGPEPIKSGALVTITGQLQHASWEDARYHGLASTVAYLQFKSLTGTYKNYGKGTTTTGLMVRHIHQRVSGCWRYYYVGTATNNTATSGADCVAVG
jgi:hypothetical protein